MSTPKIAFVIIILVFVLAFVAAVIGYWFVDWRPDYRVAFTETQYSFGRLGADETASHVFSFTNEGRRPVQVARVKSSCRCIVDETSREVVNPGEWGVVGVTLSTQGISPPSDLTRQLVVFFDREVIRPTPLTITAEVVPAIAVRPPIITFTDNISGHTDGQELILENERLSPEVFRNVRLVSTEPYYEIREEGKSERERRFRINLLADKAPLSCRRLFVEYEFHGRDVRTSIPVRWERRERVEVVPSSYVVVVDPTASAESLRATTKQHIRLISKRHLDLAITDISVASEEENVFEWLINKKSVGAEFAIWVQKVPSLSRGREVHSGLLLIKFEDTKKGYKGQVTLRTYLLVPSSAG